MARRPITPVILFVDGHFDNVSSTLETLKEEGERMLYDGDRANGGLKAWAMEPAREVNVGIEHSTAALENLGMYPHHVTLARYIKENDVVTLLSGTGTGKSLILPLAILKSVRDDPEKPRAGGEYKKLKVSISQPTINQTRQLGIKLSEKAWYGDSVLVTGHCHASHVVRSLPEEAQRQGVRLQQQQVNNNTVTEKTNLAVLTSYLGERAADSAVELTHVGIDESHAYTFRTLTGLGRLMKRLVLEGTKPPKIILASATLTKALKDKYAAYFSHYGLKIARCSPATSIPHAVHTRNWETLQSDPINAGGIVDRMELAGLQHALATEAARTYGNDLIRDTARMTLKQLEKLTTKRMATLCAAAIKYYASIGQRHVTILVFCTGANQQKALKSLLVRVPEIYGGRVCIYMNVGPLREDFSSDYRGYPKIVLCTTNMQEGVTVPELKLVIDSGLLKELHGFHSNGLVDLRLALQSASSLTQRAGRAGRTEEGLYVLALEEYSHNQILETITDHSTLAAPLTESDFIALHDVFEFLMIKPCQQQIDALSKQFYAGGFGFEGYNGLTGFAAPAEYIRSPSELRITPSPLVKECANILHWLEPRDTIALLHSYQAGTFALHAIFAVMETMKWSIVRGVGADAGGEKVNRDNWNYFTNVALRDAWQSNQETRFVSEKVLVARYILRYYYDWNRNGTHHLAAWDSVLFADNDALKGEIIQLLNMITAAFKDKGLIGACSDAMTLEAYYNRNIGTPAANALYGVKYGLVELTDEGFFAAAVRSEVEELKVKNREASLRTVYTTSLPGERVNDRLVFTPESINNCGDPSAPFQHRHRYATYTRLLKYGSDKVCRGYLTTVSSLRMVAVFFNAKNPTTNLRVGAGGKNKFMVIGSTNSEGMTPTRELEFQDERALDAAYDLRLAVHATVRKTLEKEQYDIYHRLYLHRDWLLA